KNAEWHVAHQAPADGGGEEGAQLLDEVLLARVFKRRIGLEAERPVASFLELTRPAVVFEQAACRQLPDTAHDGARSRNIPVGEKLLGGSGVEREIDARVFAERGELAGKSE